MIILKHQTTFFSHLFLRETKACYVIIICMENDIISSLNKEQKEAVTTIEGPVLIIAGPGSGKTRVITHRIAYMIHNMGISPWDILAVTFTNKAANEMKERLAYLAGDASKDVNMGTFHSICSRILRRSGEAIGIPKEFVIYNDDDQISLIKRCFTELNIDTKHFQPRAVLSRISEAKNQMISPQEYSQMGHGYFEEIVDRVYERYQGLLKTMNALDFDDLLLETVRLFKDSPDTLAYYQRKYQYIMVDEFQDTNIVQYEMVRLLSLTHHNLCVVGDPDQSIYSWRAADIRNILNFEKDFKHYGVKVVELGQNYRSTKTILDIASSVIALNKDRKKITLTTDNDKGSLVSVSALYDEREEANFVVRTIDNMVSEDEYELADCAVMFRTNAQSRALEEACMRYKMPYKLVAGTRFYERKEIRDVIAYFKVIYNPSDDISLQRIINTPVRGIGDKTVDLVMEHARKLNISMFSALEDLTSPNNPNDVFTSRTLNKLSGFMEMINKMKELSFELDISKLFDYVVDKAGFKASFEGLADGEDRWANITELRNVFEQYDALEQKEQLAAMLEGVSLVSDVDSYDNTKSGVTLITLHQAKGLEYPVVFMVGMEEGILPHMRSFDDPAQMEEERRLCYVGITRAKERLYFTRAMKRTVMGNTQANPPSRFLSNIPEDDISPESLPFTVKRTKVEDTFAVNEPDAVEDMPVFKPGDRVSHSVFGIGTVITYNKVRNDAEVVVNFKDRGLKKLMQSLAHLKMEK